MGKAGASSGGLRDPPPHPTFPGSATRPPAALGPALWPRWVVRVGASRPPGAQGVPPPLAAPHMWVHRQAGMLGGPQRPHLPWRPSPTLGDPLPEQASSVCGRGVVGELSAQQSPSEGWAASAANADGPSGLPVPWGGALCCAPRAVSLLGSQTSLSPACPCWVPAGPGQLPKAPPALGPPCGGRQVYIPERRGPSAPSRFLPLLGFPTRARSRCAR